MGQQNRPVEKTVLKNTVQRHQAGYVLKKYNALFDFVEFGATFQCVIGDGWTIIVKEKRKTKTSPYLVTARLYHRDVKSLPYAVRKWHNFKVSNKNRSSAVAMLLQQATMFYHPLLKVWMNFYDLCHPHIVFPRKDNRYFRMPSEYGYIPTQTQIDSEARRLKKQRENKELNQRRANIGLEPRKKPSFQFPKATFNFSAALDEYRKKAKQGE